MRHELDGKPRQLPSLINFGGAEQRRKLAGVDARHILLARGLRDVRSANLGVCERHG
jgi:hypothetical protein